jgi:hypothetical protein
LKKSKLLLSIFFVVLVFLLASSTAMSFVVVQGGKWPHTKATANYYYVNTNNVPFGIDFPAAINAALQPWNNVPDSYFNFEYAGIDNTMVFELDPNKTDNKNGWFWKNRWAAISDDTLATNFYVYYSSNNQLVEYDVVVFDDPDLVWSPNPGYGKYDIQTILTHEAGHSLWLGHPATTLSVMYASYQGVNRNLYQDDINGIVYLYPQTGVTTANPERVLATYPNASPPTPPPPSGGGGGGGCFIATAAFGSYMHKDVMVLRNFRDSVLLKSAPGKAFVEGYYRLSPPIAGIIEGRPALRAVTRGALLPVIISARYPIPVFVLALMMIIAFLLLVNRKRQAVAKQGNAGVKKERH